MKPYYDEDGITIYHGDCLDIDAWLAADVLITVQIECPCGWRLRISEWTPAWKAEQLVAAHRCELVEPAEGSK